MITTSLLLLATHFFPTPGVTLQTRVATVPAIVKELAGLTGRPLKTSPEVENEVIFVSLGESDPDRLMALIAKADSAEWVEKDGQFVLTRSGSLRRKQERDDLRETARLLERQVSKVLVKGDQVEPSDDTAKDWIVKTQNPPKVATNYAAYMDFDLRARDWSPAGRMLSRVLRSLPAEDLAAIEIGHTIRWSTHPTRIQGRLPLDEASLNQYIRERNHLASLLVKIEKEDIRNDAAMYFRMRQRATVPVSGAHSVLLLANRSLERVELTLATYGTEGTLLDLASVTLNLDGEEPAALPGQSRWAKENLQPGAMWKSIINGIVRNPMDPAQIRLAMDPVVNDPLALFQSDAMQTLTAAIGTPLLCRIPDEACLASEAILQSSPNLGDYARALQGSIRFSEDGGVQVGLARFPSVSGSLKANRNVLKGFLANLKEYRLPSLDFISNYAMKAGDGPVISGVEGLLCRATGLFEPYFQIEAIADYSSGGRDLLRFYANCPPLQQKALWAGNVIPFGQLTPGSQRELQSAVLTRSTTVDFDSLEAPQNVDPTSYVDGLTAGMPVSAKAKLEPFVTTKLTSGIECTLEASSIGYILAQQEKGEWHDERFGYPRVQQSKFIPGMKGNMTLSIGLFAHGSVSKRLADYQIDPKAVAVAYDALPPSHLKPLMKTLEYYRKVYREAGSTTESNPPPP